MRRALELAPDIVLLDVKMPGMNGIETLNSLRAHGVSAPVLMLTMSSEDADLSAALRAGAQGYLLKDMEPEELVPALEAALRGENVVAKELLGTLARIVRGKAGGRAEAPRRSASFVELTPRELEILEHVAKGLEQQGDRERAEHHRWHRQAARQGDPAQARGGFARQGGRDRGRARPG